jgi:hypothetical protein
MLKGVVNEMLFKFNPLIDMKNQNPLFHDEKMV